MKKIKKQKRFPNHLIPPVLFGIGVAIIGLWFLLYSYAAIAPTGTYTSFTWPTGTYNSYEWYVTSENDATPDGYFYSHQFWLDKGEGGYFGIQTVGSSPTGKIAIFSIWDALASESPQYYDTFGGEGVGYTARISYNWQPNKTYRLRVSRVSGDSSGTWWGAWIGQKGGSESFVGKIKVPAAWGKLENNSVMWSERYAGTLNSCKDIAFSGVKFTEPTANSGKIKPISWNSYLANTINCPGSYSVKLSNGARQWMGAESPPPTEPTPKNTSKPATQENPAKTSAKANKPVSKEVKDQPEIVTKRPTTPFAETPTMSEHRVAVPLVASSVLVVFVISSFLVFLLKIKKKHTKSLRRHFPFDPDIHGQNKP